MAFSGQKCAHTPHPMQSSEFTFALPIPFKSIASIGQRSMHVPQAMQDSSSILDRKFVEFTMGVAPIFHKLKVSQQSGQQLQMLFSSRVMSDPSWNAL